MKNKDSLNISPYAKLHPPPSENVRWTEGFWAEWFATCHDVMIPNMWQLFDDDDISHAYANFKIAAGIEDGQHEGPKFSDGDLYKWLEAACHVYNISRDESLDEQLDGIIEMIGRVQRDDGYIHTDAIIKAKNMGEENRFHERENEYFLLIFELKKIVHPVDDSELVRLDSYLVGIETYL